MTGTLTYLLPQMEQDNIYKTFPAAVTNFPGSGSRWYTYSGALSSIKTLLCPSDDAGTASPSTGSAFVYMHYYPGSMSGFTTSVASFPCGRTNYASIAGYLGNLPGWPYPGVFGINTKTTLTSITDGTSNTLMFGEALGGAKNGARDFVAFWGSFNLPTAWGLSDNPQWYQYGSRHTGIVNFARCDGSVQALSISGTSAIFQYAAGMNDGAVFTFN